MVRLKASRQIQTETSTRFQFLMVRLKVIKFFPFNQSFFLVSIPYGSIKRAAADGMTDRRNQVSIPYGSIKRQCGRAEHLPVIGGFNSLWFD